MAEEPQTGANPPDNVSTMHTREENSMDATGSSTNGTATENPEIMGNAAGVLRDAAHRMRERASQASVPGMDVAAQAAARPLEQSADYIENRSPQDMWSDLMRFCRDHPAGSLFIGFSVGYLFHKLVR